jgi:hypothetical protein
LDWNVPERARMMTEEEERRSWEEALTAQGENVEKADRNEQGRG